MRREFTEYGVLLQADVFDALDKIEDESVDAVVVDPPYDLASRPTHKRSASGGFMGLSWDATGIPFQASTWQAVQRVMKPGAHLVAFGGQRTHHRLMVALEDAGFEIRDVLMWLFGSGFPKSLNISKEIDAKMGAKPVVIGKGTSGKNRNVLNAALHPESFGGDYDVTRPATLEAQEWYGWGTALKPAFEPIILARKPIAEKTVTDNILEWGTGGLYIEGCRLPFADEDDKAAAKPQGRPTSKKQHVGAEPDAGNNEERVDFEAVQGTGRWPPNVIVSCICDGGTTEPERLSRRDGEATRAKSYESHGSTNFAPLPGIRRIGGSVEHLPACPAFGLGSAARYFYCPKTSRSEREAGLGLLDAVSGADATRRKENTAGLNNPRAGAGRTAKAVRNNHPTVKPIELMRWLVRLVTPSEGIVLDPFMGSGSTLCAAVLEGHECIGIDREERYVDIALHRLRYWEGQTDAA